MSETPIFDKLVEERAVSHPDAVALVLSLRLPPQGPLRPIQPPRELTQ